MEILDLVILHNRVESWLIATAIALGAYAALSFTLSRIKKITAKGQIGPNHFANYLLPNVLRKTRRFFILAWSLFIALQYLQLPSSAPAFVHRVLWLITILQIVIWGSQAIRFAVDRQIKLKAQQDASAVATLGLVRVIATGIFLALMFLLTLNNLGVDITALVAGLGVGGIAIALAVQSILGDLFASLTIVLDKPFIVGDTIRVGAEIGTVQKIGLKTTRLRNLSGEQLIFPNSDLLQSRIRNFKRMEERRMELRFGVTYQTSATLLEQIPGIIKRAIEAQKQTRFERAFFKTLGPSSLDFETSYWCLDPSMDFAAQTQQAINLALVREFEQKAIDFAYPTQTLFHMNSGHLLAEKPATT